MVGPERISVLFRPRSAWEGMDLGFALARHWFVPLWALWWVSAAPVMLAALLWLNHSADLWLLFIWWLKPLYEMLMIAWLGRALFGEPLGWRRAVRRLPSLARRLWPYLLWRRLSPVRSLSMPVVLLERLAGRQRRARLRLLREGSGALWLTLVCMHFEGVLWLSGALLLIVLVPEQLVMLELDALMLETTSGAYWIGAVIGLITMSIVAPFYVGAGFALYLTRRTRLEAWDLELRFRRARAGSDASRPIVEPGRASASAVRPLGLLPIGLLVLLMPQPAPASAAAMTQELSASRAEAVIDDVLAGDDFGGQRARDVWVYIGEELAEDAPRDTDAALPTGPFSELILALAHAIKWFLLIATVAVLILLTRRLLLEAREGRGRSPRPSPSPASPIASRPLPPQPPMPANLAAAVREHLARREARAALALLYRAQLADLSRLGVEVPSGATEADCIALAMGAGSAAEREWLARLTGLWERAAYAHQSVATSEVEGLLTAPPYEVARGA